MEENIYGRLTVVTKGIRKEGVTCELWECLCSCGEKTVVQKYSVINGATTSCGCFGREQRIKANTTHGYSKHRLYSVWEGMVSRCTNPKNIDYKWYGGAGIKIAEEWEDAKNFVEWGMDNGYQEGLEIDRKNNDKGYSSDNCRFVTKKINMSNQRFTRSTNSTGYRGVCAYRGKFHAYATKNGKTFSIGNHSTALAAALARDKFIKEKGIDLPLNF